MTTLSLADKRNKATVAQQTAQVCQMSKGSNLGRLAYWQAQTEKWQVQVEADEAAIARALLEQVEGVGGGV